MSEENSPTQDSVQDNNIQLAHTKISQLRQSIARAFIGQQRVIDETIITLLAGGHALIEGVPGLGKTLLVRALATAVGTQFGRVQFTPDLMPTDVTGHAMYESHSEKFVIRRGPIFCNFLLADEINRAPAKTQAALLEVMQEQQVTIEGKSFGLKPPFMVLATQNPIEQEGTYPLPEAQLDRFLLKVNIDYPAHEEESALVRSVTEGHVGDQLNVSQVEQVLSGDDVLKLQKLVATLKVDEQVFDYAVRLVRATREWNGFQVGAGPRGAIALIRAARAQALLNGHAFVTPDDIKSIAKAALRHRVSLTPDMEIEGVHIDDALNQLLNHVDAPRS
ncbi:AAA family ATPase [Pseudomonadota bacterium]